MAQEYITVFPWKNKAELEDVYQNLFSPDFSERRDAVDRVEMWKSRCHSKIPISIEATTGLVRCTIQDEIWHRNGFLCEPPDIQLMYSTAVTRFVNLVAGANQPKLYSRSTGDIAEESGIPRWIVNIRNDSVHGRLPSLSMLRDAAHLSLAWLKERFWSSQISSCVEISPSPCLVVEKATNVIIHFQSSRFVMLTNKKSTASMDMQITCKKIEDFLVNDSITFLSALLRPGYFLHNAEDLGQILSENEESFLREKTLDLPTSLEKFWLPVVKIIFRTKKLQEFIECLLLSLKASDPLHQRISACWALKLIKAAISNEIRMDHDEEEDLQPSPMDKLFQWRKPNFNWYYLLHAGVMHPCVYTPSLIFQITDQIFPSLSKKKVNHLMALICMVIGVTVPEKPVTAEKIFTVDQLKRNVVQTRMTKKSLFQEADCDVDWSALPICANLTPADTDCVYVEDSVNDVVNTEMEPTISPEQTSTNTEEPMENNVEGMEDSHHHEPIKKFQNAGICTIYQ